MSRSTWEYLEEAELVIEAGDGNLSAFDALVGRYRPGALLLARSIVKTGDSAEDVVQDAFLSAFKSLPQLQEPARFASWFGAIVRHRSRRLAGGERRNHLPLDELILSHSPTITAELERRIESEAVRQALEDLPEEVRPILSLYYLEEWSVAQIAEFLALPATTVKWRLHAGRKQMKHSLSDCLEKSNESRD